MRALAGDIVASLPIANAEPTTHWFWPHACVIDGEDGAMSRGLLNLGDGRADHYAAFGGDATAAAAFSGAVSA